MANHSTTKRSRILDIRLAGFLVLVGWTTGAIHAQSIRIAELCASNIDIIADDSGKFPDWIELHNPTQQTQHLRNYALTDDPLVPLKYRLPASPLDSGQRVLFFASGKTIERSRAPFHLPFKLNSGGEYLALVDAINGSILQEFAPGFPPQLPNTSYGLTDESQPPDGREPLNYALLERPTPGTANRPPGIVRPPLSPPLFSVARGFFEQPFELELSEPDPDGAIRFTIDGSLPTPSHGTLYDAPILINETQVVRALRFTDDQVSPPVAHTYLFLDQVANQTRPEGFPVSWGKVSADYDMDPRITQDPRYKKHIVPALRALPTLSLSTDTEHLFGTDRGIYPHSDQHGRDWERPVSMEWIEPQGRSHQSIAGIRIQGGWFRGPTVTRKHSFRLLFKRRYGPARLDFDLFQEFGATHSFDSLILRAGANDGYSWEEAKGCEQFIRDEFGRRLALAMGHPSPRGRFAHLYLNGLYWGLYNVCERPNEDFSASYLGGAPERWDAINTGMVKNGSLTAWTALTREAERATETLDRYFSISGRDLRGNRIPDRLRPLDLDHYVDYLLVNIWLGNADWPDKNYWLGWNRDAPEMGFRFYPWDLEVTMGNHRTRSPLDHLVLQDHAMASGVTQPHSWLVSHPEYRIAFADRVHHHLTQSKVLSIPALRTRYRHWANTVEPAIVTEAARWGDDQFKTPRSPEDWYRERDWILNHYLLKRGGIVLSQLQKRRLYPRINPPLLLDSSGAKHPSDTKIMIASTEPEVLFTWDGTDPRLPGGQPHPEALTLSPDTTTQLRSNPVLIGLRSVWRYAAGGISSPPDWSTIPPADSANWKVALAPLGKGTKAIQSTLALDTSSTKPSQPYLLRKSFSLPLPLPIKTLAFSLDCSDAVILQLNGALVYRSPELPHGPTLGPFSGAVREITDPIHFRVPADGILQAGRNELNALVFQRNSSDSVTRFDLSVKGGSFIRQPLPLHGPAEPTPARHLESQSTARNPMEPARRTRCVPGNCPPRAWPSGHRRNRI